MRTNWAENKAFIIILQRSKGYTVTPGTVSSIHPCRSL